MASATPQLPASVGGTDPSHSKRIYPGNYVNQLSSWQFQPVAALPGRLYYHQIGYALIPDDATDADNEFGVIVPSPDLRGCEKPRCDRGNPFVLPANAKLYHIGVRVPDMQRERGRCTPKSGIVATNTNELKFATAVGAGVGIAATASSTEGNDIQAADGTFPVSSTVQGVITPVELTANYEFKLYVTTSAGNAAGANIYSTIPGGTLVVCEACYYLDDHAPDVEHTIQFNPIEAGGSKCT